MKPQPPAITAMWGLWPTGDFGPFTFYTSHQRKNVVAFLKAPPLEPPSWKQRLQQTRFANAARLWSLLPTATRQAWTTACRRAHLKITGFNFFVYVHLRQDLAAARTIQHQSGVDLHL